MFRVCSRDWFNLSEGHGRNSLTSWLNSASATTKQCEVSSPDKERASGGGCLFLSLFLIFCLCFHFSKFCIQFYMFYSFSNLLSSGFMSGKLFLPLEFHLKIRNS